VLARAGERRLSDAPGFEIGEIRGQRSHGVVAHAFAGEMFEGGTSSSVSSSASWSAIERKMASVHPALRRDRPAWLLRCRHRFLCHLVCSISNVGLQYYGIPYIPE